MNDDSILCPKCGLEAGEELRYCRKCGTSLESVRRAIEGDARPDLEVAEGQRAMRLHLVRGLSFVILAAGFAKALLALSVAAAFGGVGFLEVLGLLLFTLLPVTFGGLAVRDLLNAYELRKNPRLRAVSSVAALTEAARPVEMLESPPSVVEHTTFPLEAEEVGLDEAPRHPAPRERA